MTRKFNLMGLVTIPFKLAYHLMSRPGANTRCSLIQVSQAASTSEPPGPGPTGGLGLVAAAAPSPAGATDSQVPSSHYCPSTAVLRCAASDSDRDSVSRRPGARSDSTRYQFLRQRVTQAAAAQLWQDPSHGTRLPPVMLRPVRRSRSLSPIPSAAARRGIVLGACLPSQQHPGKLS
jgi:hypothetical protein